MSTEDVGHWKQLAEQYKASWLEAKAELEDYQASSRDLELELEAQAEQAESRCRQLDAERTQLLADLEALQERYEKERAESSACVTRLQEELAEVCRYRDTLEQYVRELEQTNDDLERAKRETLASLEDFELRMNQCIERNAFLEGELAEKEMLVQLVQRLKDEARDLKQEIDVRAKRNEIKLNGGHVLSSVNDVQDMQSHSLADACHHDEPLDRTVVATGDSEALTGKPTVDRIPSGSSTPSSVTGLASLATSPTLPGTTGFSPLVSPRANMSALNIVGDLLSKVGALELKLSQCRNFVKDHHYLHQRESGVTPTKSLPMASSVSRSRASLRRSNEPPGSSGSSSSNLPVPISSRPSEAAGGSLGPAAYRDHAAAVPNGWRAWFTGKDV